MNPHLALLLSRIYDGSLAPEHRRDLEKSAICDVTSRAHYIRSVPPAMIPRLLGFEAPGVRSMLLFPFRSPLGGFMDYVRVKVFPALTDQDGHQLKYLQRRGEPPRLYFTRSSLDVLGDPDVPLYLVEGLKQSLALAQLDLPAVGFCGIESWHVSRSRELLPDFDAIALEDRAVELMPDGDWQTNQNVHRGVARLADALRRRGASPRLVVLPQQLPGAPL